MRKVFQCEVDCANCAAKMQRNAEKIDGVRDVSVNFMTQKLTLDATDARFDAILDEVVKVCKKVDSDFTIKR